MARQDFFELFQKEFTEEFNKLQQKGEFKDVIFVGWAAVTATNFHTRYALFGLDSREEEGVFK